MNMLRDMLQPTRRNMLRGMFTSTSALTRFGINGVEAALALDFIGGEYRTANTSTTFADAFTGTSPKLTYSTAAGSNSTMVNSEGKIVWAPHNLEPDSNDITNYNVMGGATIIDSETFSTSGSSADALTGRNITSADLNATYTVRAQIWSETDAGTAVSFGVRTIGITDDVKSITLQSTPTWEELESDLTGATQFKGIKVSTTSAATIKIRNISVYRSDLGGMHPVPGAATGFEYYVPTNGNAEYLPRVGHHVYNGSTWVNEGLLIESEPRTNLALSSEDFTNGSGLPDGNWIVLGGAVRPSTIENSDEAPDGTTTADTVNGDDNTSLQRLEQIFSVAEDTSKYCGSVFVKKDTDETRYPSLRVRSGTTFLGDFIFNTKTGDGKIRSGSLIDDGGVIDYSEDYWRVYFVASNNSSSSMKFEIVPAFNSDYSDTPSASATGSITIWGAQFELAPTPSSYMPTNGGTYTRTAQSLTVPPAEFGWPEPEYIGSELLSALSDASWTTTTGEWTYDAADDEWDLAVSTAGSTSSLNHDITATEGSVYVATATVSNVTNVTANELFLRITNTETGTVDLIKDDGSGAVIAQAIGGDGTYTVTFVAGASTPTFQIRAGGASDGGETATLVSASVREINPLSVSIQMDGRMTYADEDNVTQHLFQRWQADGDTRLNTYLDTNSTRTGSVYFYREANGVGLSTFKTSTTTYSPGVLVPFNFAVRHGSTFVNGAVDGVALTANTTPTALPDLSSTDLKIAYDFMGTIGTFRQFAGDIGDAGLVTATNPSTEPTLSLTFDGTDGSFYNLNWSE